MHKIIRILPLIVLLNSPAPLQAKPSTDQLIARGLAKIGLGGFVGYFTLGAAMGTVGVGHAIFAEKNTSGMYTHLFTSGLGGTAVLGTLSAHLIRQGLKDLSTTPNKIHDDIEENEDDNEN